MDIRQCPHCKTRVLPSPDGACPQCRGQIDGAPAAAALPQGTVGNKCPKCGSDQYRSVRATRLVAFTNDRMCTQCNFRYSPPAPRWAAICFIVVGILLAGAMGLSVIGRVASLNPAFMIGPIFEVPLCAIGIAAIIYGWKAMRQNSGPQE